MTIRIWDFGGQEIMHATHQFFLTEKSLYLLVLNGREGDEDRDAEYWLKLIDIFGENSSVIIVQNKICQQPFDLNYRGLRNKHPNIIGFCKTDCLHGIGIDELKGQITRVCADLKDFSELFPQEWLNVKRKLENMNIDFISHEQFVLGCALANRDSVSIATAHDNRSGSHFLAQRSPRLAGAMSEWAGACADRLSAAGEERFPEIGNKIGGKHD
jgi:hypothetical protein